MAHSLSSPQQCMIKAGAPPVLEHRDLAAKPEGKKMDDLIGGLIGAMLEWLVGPLLEAMVRPLHAKLRRSIGCFSWYAALIFGVGLVLGGWSGYAVTHAS